MRKKLLDTGRRLIVHGSKQLVETKGTVESSNVTTINDDLTNNTTNWTTLVTRINIDKDEWNTVSAVNDTSKSIVVNNVTHLSDYEATTIDKQDTRHHRRRIWKDPIKTPIFSALESKDITKTTLW